MRGWGIIVLTAAGTALAGCADTTDRRLEAESPYAPSGPVPRGEAVDGLVVGHRLMAAGEFELALDAYLRAAAEHGMTADTLSALGSANLKLGRLQQAERLLRRAVETDPERPAVWNNLGVVLMEQGNTAEAKEVFRRAFALDDGGSTAIRENLRLALAKFEDPGYDAGNETEFALVQDEGGSNRPGEWP